MSIKAELTFRAGLLAGVFLTLVLAALMTLPGVWRILGIQPQLGQALGYASFLTALAFFAASVLARLFLWRR